MTEASKTVPPASVVVLTCGSPQVTLACLESVVAGGYPNLQIVLVANGAGPAVQRLMCEWAEQANSQNVRTKLIANQHNVGACTARNQALAEVYGQYVAFLDNDIICQDGKWLEKAIELLESPENIGAVGPRLVRHHDPHRLECAGYAISPRGRITPLAANRPIESFAEVRTVQAVGNFITRTETIRRIGGFDAAFDPFGFENIDCCYRIKQHGMNIVCDGRVDLHHIGHITTGDFEQNGKRILFEKSLLLRKRWLSVFETEQALYERLMSEDQTHAAPG